MKLHTLKKLDIVVLTALTLFSTQVSSCQRKHQASGGSVVGNGIIRYHNETYDYFFEYSRDLDLHKITESSIRLDNKQIAASDSSEITFSVVKLADTGAGSLDAYASSIAPTANWQNLTSSHIKAIYYRSQSEDKLNARYIYQLNRETILDVHAGAMAAANGITLISNVISSIDFDTTSPVIHEVAFEPSVAVAGQTVKLKFRATDNMGSISGRSPTGSVSIRIDETCRQLVDNSLAGIETCSELKALGNDWYEYEVRTDLRMKEGHYILYPLTIWDSAGNPLELIPDQDRGVYQSNTLDDQTKIPLAYLSIKNSAPDKQAPELTNARFEPAILSAGEETKLVFEATDNDPHFYPEKFCEKARHRDWFRFSRTDIPSTPDINPIEYSVSACSNPIKRADGAWEVKMTSEKGLPPGEYIMDFGVRDAVKNHSNIVSASLFITNTDQVDLEGPKVLEIKIDKPRYKRGDTGRILLKATDDISGIKKSTAADLYSLCRTGFISPTRAIDDNNAAVRILVCDKDITHLEGDWYAIEFKLADNVPTGKYVLPEIQISDRIGNSTILTTSGSQADDVFYNIKHSSAPTQLKLLGVEIVD